MMSTIFCVVDGVVAWICFARGWWLWDVFQNGAKKDPHSASSSRWKLWYEEQGLANSLTDAINDMVNMPPQEMSPRFSCASPRRTFAQVANVDLDASLPHVEMMPRPSFSPPHPGAEVASPTFYSPVPENVPLDSTVELCLIL